jgi:streptomycin 6-kinase
LSEKLHYYLQTWGLTNAQPLAQTNTSHVYTVDFKGETVVLKILNDVGMADEQGGAVALNCFNGNGAVRLLHHDSGAQLLEYVGGSDLVPMVQKGGDEQATLIIGDVLNQLHSAYNGKQPADLRTLHSWFRALFKQAERDQQAGSNSLYVRAASIATALLAKPQHATVLHGDIHHENIRYHQERGWLAFDPKGLYGERTYDAANTLYNPGMPELVENEERILRISKILADKLTIDHDRLLAFVYVYGALSASWSIEDGDDPHLALKIAELTESHVKLKTITG